MKRERWKFLGQVDGNYVWAHTFSALAPFGSSEWLTRVTEYCWRSAAKFWGRA